MHIRRVAANLREHYRLYGVAATLHDITYRVVNRIASLQILKGVVARLQDVKDPDLFDARGFDARFVGEDELMELACDGSNELALDFLRDALRRGDRCYGLFDGGALAAYGWYSNLPTPIDEHCMIHFDSSYTYMYKGFTVPAYRGKRLHAVGMCRVLRAISAEGRKGLISWVYSNNFASLRSVARMGYRFFGEVYVLRFADHCFTWSSPGCREYSFRVESLGHNVESPRYGV